MGKYKLFIYGIHDRGFYSIYLPHSPKVTINDILDDDVQ